MLESSLGLNILALNKSIGDIFSAIASLLTIYSYNYYRGLREAISIGLAIAVMLSYPYSRLEADLVGLGAPLVGLMLPSAIEILESSLGLNTLALNESIGDIFSTIANLLTIHDRDY